MPGPPRHRCKLFTGDGQCNTGGARRLGGEAALAAVTAGARRRRSGARVRNARRGGRREPGRAAAGAEARPEPTPGERARIPGRPVRASRSASRRTAREDRAVRRVLGTLASGEVKRVVFFRQLRIGGQLVEIAAVDRLPDVLHLRRAGSRAPAPPRAARSSRSAAAGRPGSRRATSASGASASPSSATRTCSATSRPPPRDSTARPLLVLAPSVEALERLPALHPFYRVYSWLSPLRADRLHTWDIGRTLAAESRGQNRLNGADSAFRLSSPDDELLNADRRGRIASRRLVLVGGETSALLLGFAIIAAIGLRRGLGAERRRLLARGARRWQAMAHARRPRSAR